MRVLSLSGLLILALNLSGCLVEMKRSTSLLLQKCSPALKSSLATKSNVAFQLALVGAPPACSSIQNYSCSHRIFSPETSDSKSVSSECLSTGVLNGSCFDVSTLSFSTKLASSMPNIDPKELESGGSLNYHEYACYNTQTKVTGLGSSLNDALNLAYNKCNGTVP